MLSLPSGVVDLAGAKGDDVIGRRAGPGGYQAESGCVADSGELARFFEILGPGRERAGTAAQAAQTAITDHRELRRAMQVANVRQRNPTCCKMEQDNGKEQLDGFELDAAANGRARPSAAECGRWWHFIRRLRR
jgi:hypothetical protein